MITPDRPGHGHTHLAAAEAVLIVKNHFQDKMSGVTAAFFLAEAILIVKNHFQLFS